ncbi:Asp-tRNA(Asn)/Glu-tRNA(Gln) amidotransferase subunit GatA [Fulvivirga maritima]|uniref:Asp-tRNA(Asn)/Glu-tRNA(Gln) amidotransferase subunit GatA n=1 Tax=Fulvivirga maritima TaxID=2904247 RepID=UPI001F3E581D|nr:Asp-tRNA(Asn)/Glu-tRNA(Gln) amidotransferase subunit GatA [Fulvivirga maritima]UII27743.1 Asp-tRNA(Asn)/Glu-tRNA(Gln) amidotransferase subunit GatA [Fulvivirga maritima]
MELYTSLNLIQEDLKSGKTTCCELVEYYLKNIEDNKHLNAFLEVYTEEAKDAAKKVDVKIKEGTAGPLAGLVVSIKDVLCHIDHGLQASSNILEGFQSQFNGTAIQRLIDADAIIIGRTNCDEFAMGSSNENSAFGPVLNAIDNERVPGGSSGGAAVSVQADMCLVALGSDTGGSVRQPAAFCGVIGLKPTYSRISRHGLMAYASSFDCIGLLAKNVDSIAATLEVIAGADDYDSTVSQKPVPEYSKNLAPEPQYKIAYIRETMETEGINQEVKAKTVEAIEKLKQNGHEVEVVDFPLLDYLLATYYILTTAEASSNLSRYDGVKYGFRSPHTHDLESMYKKTRSEGFGHEVKTRIMLGTFVLSASYYDAYYTKAQKVRRMIRDETKKILSKYDFIVLPTTPTTAFKLGEHSEDPLEMYLADLFTVQSSVSGLPTISIPNGKDKGGLPIGLQIVSDDFQEEKILAFSDYLINLN